MPGGYAGGPAIEERLDAIEQATVAREPALVTRRAVYGSTAEAPEKHFIGWLDDVDPDKLFASGKAWGLSIVRKKA